MLEKGAGLPEMLEGASRMWQDVTCRVGQEPLSFG